MLEPTAVLLVGLDIEAECFDKRPVDTHKVVTANLRVDFGYLDTIGQYKQIYHDRGAYKVCKRHDERRLLLERLEILLELGKRDENEVEHALVFHVVVVLGGLAMESHWLVGGVGKTRGVVLTRLAAHQDRHRSK